MTNHTRRNVLRGAGVALALPLFESLPRAAFANGPSNRFEPDAKPRRMVCICNSLSLHAPFFLPQGTGYDWKPSRYLKELEEFRDDMTVFSGVSHPEVDGGHVAEKSFLTAIPHPSSGSFKNSISLDQYAAEFIGRDTRFPSIVMSAQPNSTISWTRAGVPIPGEKKFAHLFEKLFLDGGKAQVERRVVALQQGQSIMDTVMSQAKSLTKKLGKADREKFDEYLSSVRGVERQMVRQQAWAHTPKPKVNAKKPRNIIPNEDVIAQNEAMMTLAFLAFQTDSTRLASILTMGLFLTPPIAGVETGYHTVSHHGRNGNKLAQLSLIETEQMRVLARFLRKLRDAKEGDERLLDRTMVFYGSNMGNASNHDNRNLPAMLFGGGFKHGQHLAFDTGDNEPLCNVYLSMLHRLGIKDDRFGSSTRTIHGLELA